MKILTKGIEATTLFMWEGGDQPVCKDGFVRNVWFLFGFRVWSWRVKNGYSVEAEINGRD